MVETEHKSAQYTQKRHCLLLAPDFRHGTTKSDATQIYSLGDILIPNLVDPREKFLKPLMCLNVKSRLNAVSAAWVVWCIHKLPLPQVQQRRCPDLRRPAGLIWVRLVLLQARKCWCTCQHHLRVLWYLCLTVFAHKTLNNSTQCTFVIKL